ncbi:MAG: hypothetical protein QG612_1939, partial [Pseudomonadota bacterium]|nr:hypothetical protein [Pseudomonadota bacterium]
MEASKLQTRLKVALLSLPPRTQAVLDFFFSSSGRSSFAPSGEDIADLAIFDFDTLESRQHWEAFRARSGRPGIVLSTQPQQVEGAVWVHKPVTPASLLAAAADLRAGRLGEAPTLDISALASDEPVPAAQWQAEVQPVAEAAMHEPLPEPVALAPVVEAPAPAPAPMPAPAPVPVPAPAPAPVRAAPPMAAPAQAARPGGFGGLLRRLFGGGRDEPAPVAVPAPMPAPVPVAAPVPAPVPAPTPVAAPV